MKRKLVKLLVMLGWTAGTTFLLLGLLWIFKEVRQEEAMTLYLYLLNYLEHLEALGLPTLRGSESGWPEPTATGQAAWWVLLVSIAFGLVCLVRWMRRLGKREPIP